MGKETEDNELKGQWEKKAGAYNDIFDFLKKCGLSKNMLICFSKLLAEYINIH